MRRNMQCGYQIFGKDAPVGINEGDRLGLGERLHPPHQIRQRMVQLHQGNSGPRD